MRFLGQTTEGVYRHDPLNGIHPDAINRYYGVAGPRQRRRRHQTGAGIASDEEDQPDESDAEEPDQQEELENRIQADLAQNIRHSPVKVAKHRSPFKDPADEQNFLGLLGNILQHPDLLPEDYGILEAEWEDADYPETESIRPGTKGKELEVILPRGEWFPRAARWSQGLDLLVRFLDEVRGSDTSDDSGADEEDSESD